MKRFSSQLITIRHSLIMLGIVTMLIALPTLAQEEPGSRQTPSSPMQKQVKGLLDEINRQQIEIEVLRTELADAQLNASRANRDLAVLQKFIEDYQQLGTAYEEYQGVRDITEREARAREAAEARKRYEQIKAAKRERYQEARAARKQRRAEQSRLDRYRKSGFSALGLDVYASRISYYYSTKDATKTRIDYQSGFGHYLRLYPAYNIDYSKMTVSGSILNASADVRNIGVAITFFDESGNQVGHEIIQVSNARPDVPYPFTSTIDMALNRAFDSSSTYVLYADVVEIEEEGE
ncbi:MAG: hypothetical protein IID30_11885 [Planctomycetes bacterium]|nr:hypothetical protein [Planctomycetota bacterium]